MNNTASVPDAFRPAWRHDPWILAEGLPDDQGERREYLVHTESPQFRCRIVAIDPTTGGLPEPYEDPADVGPLAYKIDIDTVLVEFEWTHACPDVPQLYRLLEAAADALERFEDEAEDPNSPPARVHNPKHAESVDRVPWSSRDVSMVAFALHSATIGAADALAKRLGVDAQRVEAWTSGAEAIPHAMIQKIRNIVGVGTPAQKTWRRDEWIVGDGPKQTDGRRREYLMHLFPPRFRCRLVAVDPETGLAEPHESPADLLSGITLSVAENTVLAELERFDPCPDVPKLQSLRASALDALLQQAER